MKTRNLAFMLIDAIILAACSDSSTGLGYTGVKGGGGTGGGGSIDSGGATAPLLLMTNSGPVRGTLVGATRVFLGIPYAQPPVGDLRWRSPRAVKAWTDVLDASSRRAACPQIDMMTNAPLAGTSEDCLTLNVWTPAAASTAGVPTLVWIHGGGFSLGSGGEPAYDGQVLSEATGAVVVTINYRLGPLGFLAHSALATQDPSYPSSGNYGFEDQRAALQWTQVNVAAFGGSPHNVTLFGESAGGISVCLHMLSTKSGGLFHRAILQSGPCTLGTGTTGKEAEGLGDKLAEQLDCTDPNAVLECLRSKTANEVVGAIKPTPTTLTGGGLGWYPNVDGINWLDTPTKLFEAGIFSKVPTLLGTNKDEGTVFFPPGAPAPTTEAEFSALMEPYFPGRAAQIVAKYTSAVYGTVKHAAEEAIGDGLFVCPTRMAARALAGANAPTYVYQFAHAVTSAAFPGYGAFHGSEIPFIFGNPYWQVTLGAEEQELAKTMRGYWSRMARSASPNGGEASNWPKYDATTESAQVLDLTISTAQGQKRDVCDFWAGLGGGAAPRF